jgi:hypothetical protein
MTILRSVLLALVIATSGISAAAAQSDEATRVAAAQARGQMIYDLDQAAWHSTDVLLKALPKARMAEIKGWVVTPGEDGLTALYYGYEGDAPYGVFSAVFRNGKVVSSREIKPADADRALTPVQRRMALARKVASTAKVQPCARAAFNTVIVPPASDTGPVEVYLLTPQVKAGEYPFGGHYLITVGADGAIASTRPFMKSCMTQALPPNAVAAMVTHLLDPTPTEIHAWLARWMGKSVYVMVVEPEQLWEVTDKGLKKVDAPK